MNDTMQAVLGEIAQVLEKVDALQFEALQQALPKTRRVFVSGEGRVGLVCRCFAMRLGHIGYTAYVCGETITPALQPGDVLLAVSGSGESGYTVADAQKAKKKGARVCVITAKPASTLASLADQILVLPGTLRGDSGEARGSIQLLSSLYDQSLHVLLDVLALQLSRQSGTSNEAATQNHW